MPLGTPIEHRAGIDPFTFYMVSIQARNARLVFITDHESSVPALGNPAIGTPTRLGDVPVVAAALPFTNYKYEIVAKSIAELLARKFNQPVFLFLDVHFESSDPKATKALKVAAGELAEKARATSPA